MIEPEDLDALAAAVAELNSLDLATAEQVVAAVGDTPEMTRDGQILARLDDGRELKVKWPADEEG